MLHKVWPALVLSYWFFDLSSDLSTELWGYILSPASRFSRRSRRGRFWARRRG